MVFLENKIKYQYVFAAFLGGKCIKERDCECFHCLTPYQWQYFESSKWISFSSSNNHDIENSFTHVSVEECSVTMDNGIM